LNNADRSERIKALAKVALGILRRNAHRFRLDLAEGSVHTWDLEHGLLSLSYRRRIDADDRPATLTIKYRREKVLIAQWTIDGWTRRSYKAGEWENVLRRCERMPSMADRELRG
jgi:hypothetical protein